MRFYSGKGDGGTTTLFGSGRRVPKTGKVFEALGALDELNSYLGICASLARDKKIKKALAEVQENLFILQAEVGNSRTPGVQKLSEAKLKLLEKTTDEFGGAVGIITKFTLPGGTLLSAHLDYARALARKAERAYLAANLDTGCPSGHSVSRNSAGAAFLNRLSSLLFVLARYANKKAGKKEKNPKYK